MPIPYMALSQYARDHGIVGDEFRMFQTLMREIDAEWLDHRAEQQKKKEGET